ncbi:MAG: hypothetical protein ACU0CI_08345 [Shimia sp.]
MAELEARLLAAHAAGDRRALAGIYREAADAAGDEDTEMFLLTQAFVFALECGADASALHARLSAAHRQ